MKAAILSLALCVGCSDASFDIAIPSDTYDAGALDAEPETIEGSSDASEPETEIGAPETIAEDSGSPLDSHAHEDTGSPLDSSEPDTIVLPESGFPQ